MIIMKTDALPEQITEVIHEIKRHGLRADIINGEFRTVIGIIGDERNVDFNRLQNMPGVKEVFRIETPYKLISREYDRLSEPNRHFSVTVGDVEIGGEKPVYLAGPCTIESREQLFRIAEGVKKAGAHILRGGVFKPRTSVYSFQGLGASGEEEARLPCHGYVMQVNSSVCLWLQRLEVKHRLTLLQNMLISYK